MKNQSLLTPCKRVFHSYTALTNRSCDFLRWNVNLYRTQDRSTRKPVHTTIPSRGRPCGRFISFSGEVQYPAYVDIVGSGLKIPPEGELSQSNPKVMKTIGNTKFESVDGTEASLSRSLSRNQTYILKMSSKVSNVDRDGDCDE